MGEQQLADIASALYRLPLEGFVAARTAAAKAAAADAGRDLADAVRALPKPSAAAWAVNMLAVHRPDSLGELAKLGAAMRGAQEDLDAGALRALSQERRQLLTRVMGTAREVAEQQGRKVSAAVAAEVEATLRAATVDESAAAAVRSGRLLRVLSADGVDRVDLRDAVAVPRAPAQPVPRPDGGPPAGTRRASATPTRGVPEPAPPDSPSAVRSAEKPRLKAVGTKRPAPAPSAVERAEARLAEAEEAARSAAEEAEQRTADFDEAEAALTRLGDEARSLRARLKKVDEEFELARRRRESAAAQMQLAGRAAEKGQRAEVLARERVLRLRNTPD
ncbi:hypothetical protein ASF98_03245 [Arthrobacter sp. Leaf337]|uniref:hypothetical protein n=1 Tax=Arthrobacter sp. Leaf337 TaxID=1736342 RepID=UPI000700ED5C|nr:hypothetical protein [Arthrobacter sp. Leaf337]KQR74889.1 hypothetical protein ASF98_03245 [Arthrobacter sp. Leaf337]